jgi:predicted MFS family arabinose efflux permease
MSAQRPDAAPGGRAAIVFTPYQKFVVFLLAFLQFTVVLDFMVLSPLGAFLLRDMGLSTAQFGRVVSAYAFSAGVSGLLAAGFADKFDRRKLLLFFYAGFVGGTFLCGIANTYTALLLARMVTGVFGGVISSISFAIITDLFPFEARGRVMGTVQSAFAASQVLGLPIGLKLATTWGWHSSFLMIAGVSAVAGVLIALKLQPITEHLKLKSDRDPVAHLIHTAKQPRYIVGYTATMLLATGGFMLMPFGTTFSVRNMLIPASSLWIVYMITGVVSMIGGPLIGRWSDVWGKYRTFVVGTVLAIGIVIYYTNLGPTGLTVVTLLSCLLFLCISARMISASALTSGVPAPPDRGAYMSITSSLQQISGGLASALAGVIVKESPNQGPLLRYGLLGIVASVGMVATLPLMFNVHRVVMKARAQASGPAPGQPSGQRQDDARLASAAPSAEH